MLAVMGRIARPMLQVPPMLRVWSQSHYRYVDPEAPDEDPDTCDVWIDSELPRALSRTKSPRTRSVESFFE